MMVSSRANFRTTIAANHALGPAGKLIKLLDRHPMRPAHIHLVITQDKYAPLTTQIFDRESPYVDDDAVFAVKTSLVVDFKPLDGTSSPRNKEAGATLELEYDVSLAPVGSMAVGAKATNGAVKGNNVQVS